MDNIMKTQANKSCNINIMDILQNNSPPSLNSLQPCLLTEQQVQNVRVKRDDGYDVLLKDMSKNVPGL